MIPESTFKSFENLKQRMDDAHRQVFRPTGLAALSLMDWSIEPTTDAPDGEYYVEYDGNLAFGVVVKDGKFSLESTNVACYLASFDHHKDVFPLRYDHIKLWDYIPHRFIEYLTYEPDYNQFVLVVGS